MTARVLLRDIKDEKGLVKWPAGKTLDFSPAVWAGICDKLGVTLPELTAPASDESAQGAAEYRALTEELERLENENDALREFYRDITGQEWGAAEAAAEGSEEEVPGPSEGEGEGEGDSEEPAPKKKGKGK